MGVQTRGSLVSLSMRPWQVRQADYPREEDLSTVVNKVNNTQIDTNWLWWEQQQLAQNSAGSPWDDRQIILAVMRKWLQVRGDASWAGGIKPPRVRTLLSTALKTVLQTEQQFNYVSQSSITNEEERAYINQIQQRTETGRWFHRGGARQLKAPPPHIPQLNTQVCIFTNILWRDRQWEAVMQTQAGKTWITRQWLY